MKLLLVGDERKNRRMLAWGFAAGAYQVKMASTRKSVEALIEAEPFHAACIDWKMQEDYADGIVEMMHARLPELPIVALIGENARKTGPSLKERGVSAYLVSPFPIENLQETIRRHALTEPVLVPKEACAPAQSEGGGGGAALKLMTNDEIARRTLELALRAAKSNA